MAYRYEDIPDKSKEGMDRELQRGLVIAAVYFQQTLGVPVECFSDWVQGVMTWGPDNNTKATQWLWYMNFRNKHPKLYK